MKGLLKDLSEKNELQLKLGEGVKDDAELDNVIQQIENALIKNGVGKDFLQLEELQRLTQVANINLELKQQIEKIESKTKRLFLDKDKIETLSFGAFYQKGKDLFDKLNYSKDICPFCDQSIVNKELLKLINSKLRLSSDLNKEKEQLLEDLEVVHRSISTVIQNINSVQSYYKNYFDKFISFENINPEIALATYKHNIEDISCPNETIVTQVTTFTTKAVEALKQLETLCAEKSKIIKKPSQKLNEINESVIKIKEIRSLFFDLRKQSSIKEKFENQRRALEEILTLYEQFEKKTMDSVLKTMSEDINRFYTILHQHDEHEDVRLDFSEKGRGITFKLSFHKQEVDQPIKYLSDSHLNSLGLCFFLASVKHLNKTTELIILDDVVNSIDANHRRQLIEIIRDYFKENQFLILTHDQTWFEMLNQQLEGLGWKSYEIISWHLESVVIEPTKDKIQKVQELINKSNGEGVAQHLRIYFEQELKRLCRTHHISVGYREEYRPEDLWQPLKEFLKTNTYLDPDHSSYKGLFNDIQTNRYLFNLDLHDKSKKLTLSKGDMQYALDKYQDFLKIFRCEKCTKTVKLDKNGYLCSCGHEVSINT